MPLYRYRAITSAGKTTKGVIDADSLLTAKERLRKQQVLVTEVSHVTTQEKESVLSASHLLAFTREVSQLLKAGLPLYESLVTIEEKYRRHPAHRLFLDLCDRLKEGSALSTALKRYPKTFDRIYISMVQVAEESGNLAAIFEQLYQLHFRQQKVKKQLSSALSYPSFLALFCFFIVCGLLFFVVPSMKELFEGRSLHPVTQLVLAVSDFANANLYTLAALLSSCVLLAIFAWKNSRFKAYFSPFLLRIPLAKTLLLHTALARLSRALSLLLQGGVPLLQALHLAKNVVKSPLLEDSLQEVELRVIQGEKLSIAFTHAPLMPQLVLRMLSLAEETGRMGDAFFNLAEIYEEEMQKHLEQLNTFLQPALLIALGAIVGLVVLSILLPLTDVSSFTN